MRTIDWSDDRVVLLDQTKLPNEQHLLEIDAVDELVAAIRRLAVRGAPALGAAGALGVLLAVQEAERAGWDQAALDQAIDQLRQARPTAVNLARAVDRVAGRLPEGAHAVREEAQAILDEDVQANRALSRRGADLLTELTAADPLRIYTHCNTGALATVDWGTALGIARELHQRGRLGMTYAGETRPLLQGSRLTAWELEELGIEYRVVVDSAGAGLIAARAVDAVIVGADRVAANGDVVNKVGTYGLALAAARHGIPFMVAAPESTLDPDTKSGDDVPIELRAEEEVLIFGGIRVAPETARAHNPAFDVTPAEFVTALVTERRVVRLADGQRPT